MTKKNARSADDAYPYPRYTRILPLSRIFFRGFEFGEESGIRRGRFQMGATDE